VQEVIDFAGVDTRFLQKRRDRDFADFAQIVLAMN
jgi:hypothetical protein